jgi:hypothetical protein
MKRISLSKTVRTISLLTILSSIQGMSIVQTAQAIPAGKPGSVCSDAYFTNPDFMYNVRPGKQQKLVDKFGMDSVRMKKQNSIWAKSNTFSVALDAPSKK